MGELEYAAEFPDFTDDELPAPRREPKWGLDDALTVVRHLQKEVRPFGYHIALGGGVLNKGMSEKDLDLYFLPLVGEVTQFPALMHLFNLKFGSYTEIGSGGDERDTIYQDKLQFVNGGKRVDVFVVDGGSK